MIFLTGGLGCLQRFLFTDSNNIRCKNLINSTSDIPNEKTPIVYPPLDPWYLTGYSDAESSFMLKVIKSSTHKLGWAIKPTFAIHIHVRDIYLLYRIRNMFGGSISIDKNMALLSVQSKEDLEKVISHFNKYVLKTKKKADFELFKLAKGLIDNKEHLTPAGLQKIINIRASMNKGLTPRLKEGFTNTIPVKRPDIEFDGMLDPNWLSGFAEGEAYIKPSIFKAKTTIGYSVKINFILTQHIRDQKLITSLVQYLDCGWLDKPSGEEHIQFLVTNFSDIKNKIIPFFTKYPFQGQNKLDFNSCCEIVGLIENKLHLTNEGLEKIKVILSSINTKSEK